MTKPYPFGPGDIRLLFSERSEAARPILLGTRTSDPRDSIHLFAKSDVVKRDLEKTIASWQGVDNRVHPNALELRAAVSSITFFECVAAQDSGRTRTPHVIEHDNWHRIFWVFVGLFESGSGFIARWEDRYSYMRELWENEPKYAVGQLTVSSLTGGCGKAYSTPEGRQLFEYVDSI